MSESSLEERFAELSEIVRSSVSMGMEPLSTTLEVAIRFETRQALPDGDPCCLRRIRVEE